MGAVHCHALRLVDRGGVTMIDMGVFLRIESDFAAIVCSDDHALCAGPFDCAQCAVLDPKPALVAQENDAVARCKLAFAACSFDRGIDT